ncbi:helix-turn-helix transcriptional regulator [Candidatus Blastococcus massiliensis]|uniref:helix-turn-helix transcriptional regulator n=1 Tax=Candidatus Blastococcus massiliensis TaxID=1470358 RepID=UPI0004B9B6E1|nr:WYL domain-containing protein [Candidatus Blastococcus massiliensis]
MTRTEPRSPAPLPPVSFTPEEAAAITAALAARPDGPFAEAGGAALEKVLTVLEPDPQLRARMLASSRWVAADVARERKLQRRVEQGVAERRVLVLDYRDREGRWSERAVEPQLLVRSGTHEFLVAWCRERQELRWFREDRIGGAELTGEIAPGRDLGGLGMPPNGRPTTNHPAGRALRQRPTEPRPPRLVVLPGGRA